MLFRFVSVLVTGVVILSPMTVVASSSSPGLGTEWSSKQMGGFVKDFIVRPPKDWLVQPKSSSTNSRGSLSYHAGVVFKSADGLTQMSIGEMDNANNSLFDMFLLPKESLAVTKQTLGRMNISGRDAFFLENSFVPRNSSTGIAIHEKIFYISGGNTVYVIGFRSSETEWSHYKTVIDKSAVSFKLLETSKKQKLTLSNGKVLKDGVKSDKFVLRNIEGADGRRKLSADNFFFSFTGKQRVSGRLGHSGYDEPSAMFVLDKPLFAQYDPGDYKGYQDFSIDEEMIDHLERTVGYDTPTQVTIKGGYIFECPCSPPFMDHKLILAPK